MESIDLFIVCRQDPKVPIEETMGALKELVAEGTTNLARALLPSR